MSSNIILAPDARKSLSETSSLSGSQPQFTILLSSTRISPSSKRENNLLIIKPHPKLRMLYGIAVHWQNMGDYFFSPVKLPELENFKEFFDDWGKQFYFKLNWLITSSHNNGLCVYPKGALSIHLKESWGSNASWSQNRKLGEIVCLVKEGGMIIPGAMRKLLFRMKIYNFLKSFKASKRQIQLDLGNSPWWSDSIEPGMGSGLWSQYEVNLLDPGQHIYKKKQWIDCNKRNTIDYWRVYYTSDGILWNIFPTICVSMCTCLYIQSQCKMYIILLVIVKKVKGHCSMGTSIQDIYLLHS